MVTDNPDRSRFELRIDGELAGWLDYRPAGESVILAHTEVVKEHEHQGRGGELVLAALQAVRAGGKTAIPTCPFAAAYVERHPELDAFLAPFARRA